MSESGMFDREPGAPELNRIQIIDVLREAGVDVELTDWIDHDDNQILGDLATHALELGVEIYDLYELCGIDIEEDV